MTTQAQATMTEQDLASINAFCDDLETYLKTGVLPVLFGTWKGPQVFHVHKPLLVTHRSGDRKIEGKIISAPQDFEHMIGQHHSLSVLL